MVFSDFFLTYMLNMPYGNYKVSLDFLIPQAKPICKQILVSLWIGLAPWIHKIYGKLTQKLSVRLFL